MLKRTSQIVSLTIIFTMYTVASVYALRYFENYFPYSLLPFSVLTYQAIGIIFDGKGLNQPVKNIEIIAVLAGVAAGLLIMSM